MGTIVKIAILLAIAATQFGCATACLIQSMDRTSECSKYRFLECKTAFVEDDELVVNGTCAKKKLLSKPKNISVCYPFDRESGFPYGTRQSIGSRARRKTTRATVVPTVRIKMSPRSLGAAYDNGTFDRITSMVSESPSCSLSGPVIYVSERPKRSGSNGQCMLFSNGLPLCYENASLLLQPLCTSISDDSALRHLRWLALPFTVAVDVATSPVQLVGGIYVFTVIYPAMTKHTM